MDGYRRGGHSKFSLKVHLIFVTKYRRPVFADRNASADVKSFLESAAMALGYSIIQMETDKDHVHILLDYSPDTPVSEIARQMKQRSTYEMWKVHGDMLASYYWKHRHLWSDGYFACSIGQVSQEIIEKYIQNQG